MEREKDLIRKSKFLSLVLRHRPELIELKLNEQGWTEVTHLLEQLRAHKKPMSKAELEDVVSNNSKQRFAFNEDQSKIRANQGHSIQIDLGYTAVQPPEYLFHGTADRFLASIITNGIQKRKRHHVHLSSDEATARIVGSRHGQVIILKIESDRMHKDGITFFQSENGVWLTDYVDPKYIIENKR